MPRIFDNIHDKLVEALKKTLPSASHADFCVGYFNLRGWRELAPYIDQWIGGDGACCRLLVGMQGRPDDDVRRQYSLRPGHDSMDVAQIKRLKQQAAETFRQQLMFGAPTNQDEKGLQTLSRQLREKKLVVKLYLEHTLHAKLYLLHREDYNNPITGFLGSSNLTLSGLKFQGELNVDVLEQDACQKLSQWFEDRWNEQWCLDISEELAAIIDESWAREVPLSPYSIYLKMAYHLSQEARAGLSEFTLPKEFRDILFDYQAAAVKIAAHHLNKRGGVMLGDVVGLGKTLMATAVARIFQDDQSLETLIICPPNLVPMWERYKRDYRLLGDVLSSGKVIRELPGMRRYRLIIIDENHNLRNRGRRTYNTLREYIATNESRCILLSATPYNMNFTDLSAQLGLFIDERRDLGIRPEHYLRAIGGEAAFTARHQVPVRSLKAFEQSEYIDDWRDLMRLFLVRRTRSFIVDNYTETNPATGRRFLRLHDGRELYFPQRVPKTVQFDVQSDDPYHYLYSDDVVSLINGLHLPRYGLGQYVAEKRVKEASEAEKVLLDNLGRAGKRLMGFCRTNLFKRLESSGYAFLQSLDRHILRNHIYLYAIANGLEIPIGALDAVRLDPEIADNDEGTIFFDPSANDGLRDVWQNVHTTGLNPTSYESRAETLYRQFAGTYRKRFSWLSPVFFTARLVKDLRDDADHLNQILTKSGVWHAEKDSKLSALVDLLNKHRNEKMLIFSQFADTVGYLFVYLQQLGIPQIGFVSGTTSNATTLAERFSPQSNNAKNMSPEWEFNILIATDVLSEGQNLQDAAIVVNYDLPWAIIRLVQRAGRVDRIGQQAEQILCYSFLPAEGVEQIIRLRARVRQRLAENGEVVGSDERFFEDDDLAQTLRDLYTEKSGILDAEADSEVDLASYAYQIWLNATKDDKALAKQIEDLPDVVYSTRQYTGSAQYPEGVLVYMKTEEGTDSLAWIDKNGNGVTQSQLAILKAAACTPDTPAQERYEQHHELVAQGVELMIREEQSIGGQLGRPSSARRRVYDRLTAHFKDLNQSAPLLIPKELARTIDDIYKYPLRKLARDALNRQFKVGISDEALAELAMALRGDGRLSFIQAESEAQEPRILCSLGLFNVV